MTRALSPACLVLRLGSPGDRGGDVKAIRRSLQAVLTQTRPLGVRVAVNTFSNRLSASAPLVRLLEENADLRHVGICLDFGYGHATDLVDSIEAVGGHLRSTHIHDVDGRAGRHLVPFDGKIDWPAAIIALQKIGYDGLLTFRLETARNARNILRRAANAREKLARLLV